MATTNKKQKPKPAAPATMRRTGRIPLTEEERSFVVKIGQEITEKREKKIYRNKKMTQSDLSHLAFSTPSHINKIEQGTTEVGLIKFMHICAAIGADPMELLRKVWPGFLKYHSERNE